MIATLKFKLPEEQSDYYLATKGFDSFYCLWDLDQYLRGELKYQENPADTETIREKLHELMEERNINFDEVE